MENNDTIKTIEGKHRRLGYTNEFHRIVEANPGILNAALRLAQQAEDEYDPPSIQIGIGELKWNKAKTRYEVIKQNDQELQEPMDYSLFILGGGLVFVPGETLKDKDTGLEVTLLGKRDRDDLMAATHWRIRNERTSYFKVSLGNNSFFVKKSNATDNPGYEEFTNSHKVAEALIDLKDIEVVHAQLGYADDRQSWFVSRWEDLESKDFIPFDSWYGNVDIYGQFMPEEEYDAVKKMATKVKIEPIITDIAKRLQKLGLTLTDIPNNFLYNPKTGKMFFLDITDYNLHDNSEKTINQLS